MLGWARAGFSEYPQARAAAVPSRQSIVYFFTFTIPIFPRIPRFSLAQYEFFLLAKNTCLLLFIFQYIFFTDGLVQK